MTVDFEKLLSEASVENAEGFLRKYAWAFILAGVILMMALVFWLNGKYEEHKVESEIRQTQTGAQTAVNVAVADESRASDASEVRRAEDDARASTIRPKLEAARRNSANSQKELERAKANYNANIDPQTITSDWADNCTRLKRLWPDTKFDYCER